MGFISTTTSTALVGYLFSSFCRVLDFKSKGPWFNSRLGWIVYFYISSLSRYIATVTCCTDTSSCIYSTGHSSFLAGQRSRWFSCTQCSISLWGPKSGEQNSDPWKDRAGMSYFSLNDKKFLGILIGLDDACLCKQTNMHGDWSFGHRWRQVRNFFIHVNNWQQMLFVL